MEVNVRLGLRAAVPEWKAGKQRLFIDIDLGQCCGAFSS
jgi:hypothetical protein